MLLHGLLCQSWLFYGYIAPLIRHIPPPLLLFPTKASIIKNLDHTREAMGFMFEGIFCFVLCGFTNKGTRNRMTVHSCLQIWMRNVPLLARKLKPLLPGSTDLVDLPFRWDLSGVLDFRPSWKSTDP